MNLSELATPICAEVRQTDAASVAFCKLALTRWMRTIWNKALWKDSLVAFEQILSPDDYAATSTWLPTKGVLLCPTIIDRVVAARLDSRRLMPQRQDFYYCIDYDTFAASGQATEFVLLPKCVWEFDTATAIKAIRNSIGDNAAVLSVETLNSDGIDIDSQSLTLVNTGTVIATTERVDSATKLATTGSVIVGTLAGITCVNNLNVSVTFTADTGGVVVLAAGASGVCPSTNSTTMITATWISGSDFATFTGNTFGTATLNSDGDISYDSSALGSLSYTSVATIAATSQSASKRDRIRLLQIPVAETTIRVLGKRTMPTFENDLDVVPLTGAEGCLGAFAQASMLRRERQYGKAQAMLQEALSMLDLLIDNETVQQANHSIVMPASGFGYGVCRPNWGFGYY
jgi:hypothetical protein